MNGFTARYCATPQAKKRWMIFGGISFGILILIIIIVAATSGGYPEDFRGRMVLSEVPLVDGHNTFANWIYFNKANSLEGFNFNANLTKSWTDTSDIPQTDLVRLNSGLVRAQFWSTQVDCETNQRDAVERTLDQIDVIKRLIHSNSQILNLVTRASDIQNTPHGQVASILGVAGGHAIDSRLGVLRLYYELGVRRMTLTTECSTPWAASHTKTLIPNERALSDWGKHVITEMNRLGMIIDLSLAHPTTMEDVLHLTKAPVIFSHSAAWKLTNAPQNIPDNIFKEIKNTRSLIMISFDPSLVKTTNESAVVTIDNVIDHLNYLRSAIGVDFIGIGAGFDSMVNVTESLEDVSKYPVLFDKLAEGSTAVGNIWTGWTRSELQQLASRNFIRVFEEVEAFALNTPGGPAELVDTMIPDIDLGNPADLICRTDFPWKWATPAPEVPATTTTEIPTIEITTTEITTLETPTEDPNTPTIKGDDDNNPNGNGDNGV